MTRCWILACSAVAIAGLAESAPYFLLTGARPKCVDVIASEGETLEIEYYVPDLKEPIQIATDAGAAKTGAEEAAKPEDGMDSQWNRRAEQAREAAKGRPMHDMSLTVAQKSEATGGFMAMHRKAMRAAENKGSGRIREELSKTNGFLSFDTGNNEGAVEICMQSISATAAAPSRFSLKIKSKLTKPPDAIIMDDQGRALENSEVMVQMGRLERDVKTLTSRVRSISSRAEQNKDQEAEFHAKSLAMNRAATYWPIIQLVVLVLTGFTQANHIVKFMKSRHIGL